MNEAIFKETFIASFLAGWAKDWYAHACFTGNHQAYDSMPVEDARHLAEKAWEQVNG